MTAGAPALPDENRSTSATLAVALLVVAAVACVVLDALAPGAGPLVQPLSSFAHTDYAWLWRLTVGSAAVAVLALAATLRTRAASQAFVVASGTAGAGLAVAGLFPTDLWFPWERTPTATGSVHLAAVLLVVVAFTVAMPMRSRSLPRSWRAPWLRAFEVTYAATLVGAIAYVVVMARLGRQPRLIGLAERLLLGSALAWCGVLALAAPDASRRAGHTR